MPSFIGNSSISGGGAFSLTGPTGSIGPRGEDGNRGATGITLGPTGSTGIYIKNVVYSGSLNNGLLFSLSDGTTIGPIRGFTGPTIQYSNSRGISSTVDSNYTNLFLHVTGGTTFVFRGICGDGQYTSTQLSTNGSEIILTVQGSPSGTALYGISSDNFLAYTSDLYSATNTRIRIENQTIEDNDSATVFTNPINAAVLNFGLTGTASQNITQNVLVLPEFSTPFLTIPSLARSATPSSIPVFDGIKSIDSGGYVLDLDKTSILN